MRKVILITLILLILGGFGWLIFKGSKMTENERQKNIVALTNFEKTNNYLKKFKGNYPIPEGDVILLNRKGEEIHLEDRKVPLNKIKDLYAIQGTTCDILKNDKEFNSFNYDTRYSITKDNKADGEVLFKKCFSYSVTKNRKYYQIGTIEGKGLNLRAKLDGNIKKSITRAYDSSILVKNGDTDFFPYAPEKVSPIVKVKNLSSSKIYAKVQDIEGNEYKIELKEGLNKLLSGDLNQKFQIKIYGKLAKNTDVEFIDTNGSIVYLKPTDDGKLSFKLKDYQIDTKRIDYIVEAGKFLASVVKLSPEKNMTVSNKGTTLVIRGTKFSLEANKDEFSTFLVLGHIVQKLSNGTSLDLTKIASASVLIGNKLVKNMEKVKKLIAYAVYNDIKTMPKYSYNIKDSLALTGIIKSNSVNIEYENGQKISLFSIDKNKISNYFKLNQDINIKSNNLLKYCGEYDNINLIQKAISSCSDKDSLCKSLQNKLQLCDTSNDKKACLKATYQKTCSIVKLEAKYKNFVKNYCKKQGFDGLDIDKLYYILDNKKDNLLNGFSLKDDIKAKINGNYVVLTSRNGGVNGAVNTSTRVGLLSNGSIVDIPLPNLSTNEKIDKVVIACEK